MFMVAVVTLKSVVYISLCFDTSVTAEQAVCNASEN